MQFNLWKWFIQYALWEEKGQVLVLQIHFFFINLILNQAEDQLKA